MLVYKPKGTCSREIHIELTDGIITTLEIIGGCNGNLSGLSVLLVGMRADEAIEKMRGIDCGGRGTSCPDQISVALEEALAAEGR